MKKIVISLVLLSITLTGVSQKSTLTLKDAVLNQFRLYGPDRINSFSWIPGTDAYSFLSKKADTLYTSKPSATTNSVVFTLADLNSVAKLKLSNLMGISWLNQQEVLVVDGANYIAYNQQTKKARVIQILAEEAQNNLFHEKSEAIAYTIENNVFVQNKLGTKFQVTSHTDKNIVAGQSIARNEFGISGGLFWSINGQYLAFYEKNESEVHDYPLLDISKTPGEAMLIKYPMAGQKSERPKVGVFSLATQKTVYISPKGASDDYLTNVVFTPDNKFVLIAELNRDQNHYYLNVYDVETGAFVKTLVEEQNEKWVEPEFPAFFPSEASNNFIWISEKDGFNNLYYYDFNGKLIKQLTANKFVVKEILTARKNGKEIYFNATGENATNTLVYKVDLSGKQQLVTPTEGTHSFAINDAGTYFMDSYSSNKIAQHVELYTSSNKKAKLLLNSTDKLSSVAIGNAEIGSIIGKDGSKLYTRLIKPSNFDPTKKYPVMVYVYGGPHAQMITNTWLDGANLWMYWMAEQGYLVFTLDGRGSANRGFAFESQIHRRLGDVEMEDQLSGVDYLKSLPYVDANRLAVHGWSFGGFMTTSLLLRHPDVFKVGVAGGPVTDWKYYEAMYGERYMDRPEQNIEGYKNASLLNHAANLKGDLLLIHGTIDDVVVMQHNYALVKKFVDLGIQMDFFPYPMHKHNVTGKDRVHLIEKVLTYIMEKNQ
ncbi:MAG: S9 family peptidase [Crocinitomicaceae bacterium]|nr:S9 family peptidase [Crocinitomicaceae bacterium]